MFKKILIGVALLSVVGLVTGQSLLPFTTFTQDFMKSPNAASARAKLGVGTNGAEGVTLADFSTTYFTTNGGSVGIDATKFVGKLNGLADGLTLTNKTYFDLHSGFVGTTNPVSIDAFSVDIHYANLAWGVDNHINSAEFGTVIGGSNEVSNWQNSAVIGSNNRLWGSQHVLGNGNQVTPHESLSVYNDTGFIIGNDNQIIDTNEISGIMSVLGHNLTNYTPGTIDLGVTDATKTTFGISNVTFRVPVINTTFDTNSIIGTSANGKDAISLTLGSGLSRSGNTISATGSGSGSIFDPTQFDTNASSQVHIASGAVVTNLNSYEQEAGAPALELFSNNGEFLNLKTIDGPVLSYFDGYGLLTVPAIGGTGVAVWDNAPSDGQLDLDTLISITELHTLDNMDGNIKTNLDDHETRIQALEGGGVAGTGKFDSIEVTNNASVGSLTVGGTPMVIRPDFSTNSYTGSNVVTVLTNAGWQTTVITNDVQWMPGGTGLGTHEFIASGGDWIVSVSTNFHRYTTNDLTLSTTNYQFTIPSGKQALISEVAPAPDRRNWGFIIEP
jgi:hypothetical protein